MSVLMYATRLLGWVFLCVKDHDWHQRMYCITSWKGPLRLYSSIIKSFSSCVLVKCLLYCVHLLEVIVLVGVK